MNEPRILTLHPQGKKGVNISKAKYDAVRDAILDALYRHAEISFNDLARQVSVRLEGIFEGSIMWYTETVKLDLEARGEINRLAKPHRYTLGTLAEG